MADPKTRYMANYIFEIEVKLHRNEIEVPVLGDLSKVQTLSNYQSLRT
jgi:hypothetical protein